MKKFLFPVLWLAACVVSYIAGTQKNARAFEDACHMSDLIRCYSDHLTQDTLLNDYGCFEELEGIFLYDDCIASEPVKLEHYTYCY